MYPGDDMEQLFLETIAMLRITVEALKEIKDTQGKVCNNFELCHHRACQSSYSSWAIADKALRDISK